MTWEVENNNSVQNPQWEVENSQPMTQSVMDAENKQMYNVPVGMDGRDAQFAIDTQHKGADKASFFGKVWASVTDKAKSFGRGVVSFPQQVADTAIAEGFDLETARKKAAGKAYNQFAYANNPMVGWSSADWAMPDDDDIEIAKATVENIQALRDRNNKFWERKKDALLPEADMSDADRVFEGVGNGISSIAGLIGMTAVTKNPEVSAVVFADLFGKMRKNEYVDKAIESGMDVDDAYALGMGAGAIEGGIELVGGHMVQKIAKIKPIQELGKNVITAASVKLAKSKVGQMALSKIGTRHANSTVKAFTQGFISEGVIEEGLQQGLGMVYENATDVSDYSLDEIINETLFSAFVGGISGGLPAAGGTYIYNKRVKAVNEQIKNVLQEQTPELTTEELQVTADAIQEVLYQSTPMYENELNELLKKEVDTDVMPEGLTPESLTAETRRLLKEKYEMTDEDIDRTIKSTLGLIDARNQFNEVYTTFRDGLEMAGRDTALADGEARILAARALAVARAEGVNTNEVLKRWNLQFIEQNFNDFKNGVQPVNKYAESQKHVDNIMGLVPANYTTAQKRAIRRGLEERARYGDLNAANFDAQTAKQWFESKDANDVIRSLNKRVAAITGVLNGKENLATVRKSKKINPNNINPFEALVDDKLYNKVAKADKANKGDSLLSFIVKRGGLKDVGGELKSRDAQKQRIGLINNKSGNSFDDMALFAWEHGYFPNKMERPSINELLDAIDDELFGKKHYQYQEGNNFSMLEYVDNLAEQMEMLGIDYSKMTAAEAEAAYNEASERYTQEHFDDDFTFFQFAGVKAQTAAMDQLEQAKRLEAQGVDAEQIRQQTGWFKGVDSKWRFEISDKDAVVDLSVWRQTSRETARAIDKQIDYYNAEMRRLIKRRDSGDMAQTDFEKSYNEAMRLRMEAVDKLNNGKLTPVVKLSDVLQHNALYAAYPELANLKLSFVFFDNFHKMGSYRDDILYLNEELQGNQKELKSVLMHEIQHAIQRKEDFAVGGSVDMAQRLKETLGLTADIKIEEEKRKYFMGILHDAEKVQDILNKQYFYNKSFKELMENPDSEKLKEQAEDWNNQYFNTLKKYGISKEQLALSNNTTTKKLVSFLKKATPHEVYERLLGEVEARNTQARMNMSDKERATTSPESTQDIKNADAIVVFEDGTEAAYIPENVKGNTQEHFDDDIPFFQESMKLAEENARLDEQYPTYDGETININGIDKTVYNSDGKRIAKSAEALQNFYRWFGDSKVVDADGRPLVVYHGTNKKFREFDKGVIGKKHKNLYQGKGFYFTKEYYDAQNYGKTIMPVYLKIENPALSDYNLKPENDGISAAHGVWVAFEPNQIKSTSNRGSFSGDTGNIYYQTGRKDIDNSALYKALPQNLKDAVDFVFTTPAVTEISGNEFQKDNTPITEKVTNYYLEKYNGVATNSELGEVKLDKEGVKDSLGHGIGSKKAAAYAAVPEVIKNGFIFDRQTNWKGRGYDTVVLVAPIKIAGDDYVCEVVVKQGKDRQGFYLHEVELSDKLADVFKTANGSTSASSKLIIAQQIANVNSPLYQSAFAGSRVDYDEPSLEAIGTGEGAQAHGWGLYYALNRNVAEKYRENFTKGQKIIMYDGQEVKYLKPKDKANASAMERVLHDLTFSRLSGDETYMDKRKPQRLKEYYETDKKLARLNRFLSNEEVESRIKQDEENLEALKNFDFSKYKEKAKGQVHEVDLPENPYLLDEDLHGGDQSKIITNALQALVDNLTDEQVNELQGGNYAVSEKREVLKGNILGDTGRKIYKDLTRVLGSPKAASQALESVGIKGITYDGNTDGRCFVIFNPADVRVIQKFYQETSQESPRGAYKNGIIYLFENNDASTVIHELGHFFLDDMRKFADNETTQKQLEAIYKYLGSEDGNLTTEQHEYFANSFEIYLLEGRAPNQLLGKVFARFKKWLRNLWAEVKRLKNVKLTDDIRKTFDEMLGGKGLDFTMQMSSLKMAEAAESGNIPYETVSYAIDLLKNGKMSRAEMDDILERLKTGELERRDVYKELKQIEAKGVKHNEALNPFDTVKYREALLRGNINKRNVMEKIERLMKWTEPREQNGRTVGRFGDKHTNDFFEAVRADMALDKDEAKKAIAANKGIITAILQSKEMPEIERNKILGMPYNENDRAGLMSLLALENRILSIPAKTIDLKGAIKLYSDLSDSYNIGRLTANVTGELKKARRNKMLQEAKDVLTDNGRIDWHKESGEVKKFIRRIGQSQYSWGGLMDLLSMNDKNSKTNQSNLSKMMDVFEQEQAEARGIADDGEKISRYLADALKGSGNAVIAASKYINDEIHKKVTVEWNRGRKTFTKDQLLDIYMKAQDPETRKIMLDDQINAYNEDFLQAVGMELNAQDKAVASALFKFYNENYVKINDFYEEKYGVSMPHNPFYSPRSMVRTGINVEDGSIAFAAAGFTKNRTAKAGAVDIKGAFATWNKYVAQTNHWLNWSDKLVDINSVFGDAEVKKIIESQFGAVTNSRIKTEITNMAGSKVPDGWGKAFDKVRSNFAKSVLSVKPSLMIKQLTSFPAYLEHMSVADFSVGIADFFAHPKEAINTLGNTTLMKTRNVDIIRDFAELSKLDVLKGKKGIKLSDLMMLNIKLGDRGAIYAGGWALYKVELKKNLKAGMNEADAKAKALDTFERVTDETQQSGRISQQSYWQSNPFLRAFTMFMSSQNQYLRKEINAVRGMATGRMSVKQGLKTLFIFHVLLPCLFQYAADGFDWDKDAQLKAATLGSLNGFFIVANVLSNIWDAAAGQARSKHMMIKDVLQGYGSIEDLTNAFMKLADEDYEFEDVYSVLKEFGKPAGELAGAPVKYALDLFENAGDYAENDEYFKEVLLWLGWSPYALRDKED